MKRTVSDTFFRLVLALLVSSAGAGGARAAEPVLIPVLIPEWKVVGPFESGSREGFVQHLTNARGRIPRAFTYAETYPSLLADGGRVGWKSVPADRDDKGALTGRVSLKLEGVDWDSREKEWGAAALLNMAYASAALTLPSAGLYLLEASRCSVTLNGVSIAGDPYGQGIAQSVVRGLAGNNDILVATSGFAGERAFEVKLTPMPAGEFVRIIEGDVLLPDLVESVAGSGFVGVPLISAQEGWQPGLRILIDGAMTGSADVPASLPPLGSLKVAVPVHWDASARPEGEAGSVDVRIRVIHARRGAEEGLALATSTAHAAVRRATEARNETFISRLDGSAQKYGVLPALTGGPTAGGPTAGGPTAGGPTKSALILSLHGASVECRGQAASYSPKNWAMVVAPTNRRPHGFDWHDWGAIDAEEVLALALERFPIDRDRIHLTGHSMGGHGAWAFGVSRAGTVASVAPSAGWNSYDTYLPGTTRRSLVSAPPELAELWQRGLSAGRVSTHLENLLATPVFVMHGGADDNVPPTHGRLLAGELERLGGNVIYREVPGQGHWWDIDKERPGADCVDSAELEAFWRSHVLERWPTRVVLTSADPDIARSSHWLTLNEQARVGHVTRLVAQDRENPQTAPLTVSTRNARAFSVHLSPGLRAVAAQRGTLDVDVDGQLLHARVGPDDAMLSLRREGSARWRVSAAPDAPECARPLSPGGYKKAMFEPFTLVVGTRGDAESQERMLNLARSLSLAWWVRANGTCVVVRDTEVTDEQRAARNLVLLGGPDVNAESLRLERGLLVVARSASLRSAGIMVAGRSLRGGSFASAHWQPNPEHPERRILVFQASSADAEDLLSSLNPIGGGHGLPDFVVATPDVRRSAWGGFAAAGYWSPDFQFDPAAAWFRTEPLAAPEKGARHYFRGAGR